MKQALYVPPFGELSHPGVVADIAAEAEAHGWDGLFLWDHMIRPDSDPQEIADVWVMLAGCAVGTGRLRLGAMVTPINRRRPQKLAREIITLDLLSQGRLTCGFGVGVDSGGELSKFGEETDAKLRGDMLDEGIDVLDRLLHGREVQHDGSYFKAQNVAFLPRPVQLPRPPFWLAAASTARRPFRRAARYDGVFAINLSPEELGEMTAFVASERGERGLDDFDVAAVFIPGMDVDALAAAGTTWAMHSFLPGEPAKDVLAYTKAGPTP
jgi:alkanesulfonate monooxygenase SsuD/methylene tetrahydromethanopterin reductase-like flavin-dependent oxidoreductase (luciferase family)